MAREEDLRAELATNLDGSFEQLVLAYQNRLYSFALRWTGSREDAEEIVQDAFVRAYTALKSYAADRVLALALRPWLYQIALNIARNRARGKQLRLVPLGGPDEGAKAQPARELEDDGVARPEAAFERAEHQAELGTFLAGLPRRYRAPVILRYVEGLGYAELAAVLGQPVGTAKSNVHRGIALLRKAMSDRMSQEESYAEPR
jgi:RNA polymerase sigma-70 factor (ECF subfamily)